MKKVYFIKEYNIKNSKLKIEYTGYCNENISISGIEKTLDNTFNTYNDKLDLVSIIKYLEIIFKILEDEYLVIGLSKENNKILETYYLEVYKNKIINKCIINYYNSLKNLIEIKYGFDKVTTNINNDISDKFQEEKILKNSLSLIEELKKLYSTHSFTKVLRKE